MMKGKQIAELADKSWKEIAPKSSSKYKDCFALDVSKWADILYKNQAKDSTYVPVMPNKPSGR